MARAKEAIQTEKPLYERDFCLWVEEQVRLLREGRLAQLDVVNLIDEVEGLGIHEIKAVESNLVVVLKGPAQVPVPAGTSLPQLVVVDRGTPAPAAQRSRYQPEPAPLRPCALRECYQRGRRQALIEAGLAPDAVPDTSPYTLEQTLDPEFLPD